MDTAVNASSLAHEWTYNTNNKCSTVRLCDIALNNVLACVAYTAITQQTVRETSLWAHGGMSMQEWSVFTIRVPPVHSPLQPRHRTKRLLRYTGMYRAMHKSMERRVPSASTGAPRRFRAALRRRRRTVSSGIHHVRAGHLRPSALAALWWPSWSPIRFACLRRLLGRHSMSLCVIHRAACGAHEMGGCRAAPKYISALEFEVLPKLQASAAVRTCSRRRYCKLCFRLSFVLAHCGAGKTSPTVLPSPSGAARVVRPARTRTDRSGRAPSLFRETLAAPRSRPISIPPGKYYFSECT